MKWRLILTIAAVGLFALSACGGVDYQRSQEQAQQLQQGAAQVGMPAIANYQEMRLVKQLYELRDNPKLTTYAYIQALDGSLRCLGEAIGYGIPYATQFTNPQTSFGTPRPQAEPNGLFMPDSASATWIMLLDPTTHKVSPVYVEPNLIVSQFKLPCKPLDQ